MTPMNGETEAKTAFKEEYHRYILRKVFILAALAAGTVLLAGLFSVSSFEGITLGESYTIIWNHITGVTYEPRSLYWWADQYIWNSAMPRVCIAVVAGASLAVAGTVMQALLNNPLADPYATGISSGACFGAVAAIIAGVSFSTVAGEYGIVTNAFVGAMVPTVIIILLARRIGNSPATMILVGTAISYFFNAMVTYFMVMTDTETLQEAYLWQVGSLTGLSWEDIPLMLAVTVVGAAFTMVVSRQLNVLSMGDKGARSLGMDVSTFRTVCLIVMALMTAAVISYTGIIGFIGLVAPHLVRIFIGSDNRYVVPVSMLAGSFLLLLADYLAMSVSSVSDIPVGVITSLIGSPVFFALIIWQRRSYGGLYRWTGDPWVPSTAAVSGAAISSSWSVSSRRRACSCSPWGWVFTTYPCRTPWLHGSGILPERRWMPGTTTMSGT